MNTKIPDIIQVKEHYLDIFTGRSEHVQVQFCVLLSQQFARLALRCMLKKNPQISGKKWKHTYLKKS